MKSLRISCIVPVYNGEQFLAEALDSILAQTCAPFEVIVVDDGSTDDTAAVAARYGKQIAYYRQDNAGPSAARNHGVRATRGDLVAFLDADDVWRPEKLARQAARFALRPELDISMTHARNFWIPGLRHEEEAFRGPPSCVAPASSLVARRVVLNRIGLFDADVKHKEMPGWLLHAAQRGAVVETLPDILVDRRIHHSNRSRGRGGKDAAGMLALAHALIERRRGSGSA